MAAMPNGSQFPTAHAMNEAWAAAKREMLEHLRRTYRYHRHRDDGYKFIQPRGSYVYVQRDHECLLYPADCVEYKGSAKQLQELVAKFAPQGADLIGVEQGYNGVNVLGTDDYDPWIDTTTLTLWVRPQEA